MSAIRKDRLLLAAALVLVITCLTWAAATFWFDEWASVTYVAETNGYNADGRGDSVGDSGDLAASSSVDIEFDLSAVDSQVATIFIEYDSSGTTDGLTITFHRSMDGTNYDDVPFHSVVTDDDGADTQRSFTFAPLPSPYITMTLTSGSTDTWDYQVCYMSRKTSDSN